MRINSTAELSQAKDKEMIRRRCTNREMRRIILSALNQNPRYKLTKDGIIIYGEDGVSVAVAHFTTSDSRATKNMERKLKRIGIHIPN